MLDPTIPLKAQAPNMAEAFQQGANHSAQQALAMEKLRNAPLERQALQDTNTLNQIKVNKAKTERILQLSGMARDQATYEQVLAQAKAEGLDVSDAPPTFDPEYIKQGQMAAMDIKDRLDLESKRLERQFEQEKFAETKRHNLATEQKGAGGISYTMPDGTTLEIGGSGGPGKMTEFQGQASSRGNLMSSGLKNLGDLISNPNIGGFKAAMADQVSQAGPVGSYAAEQMRSPEQQQFSVGRDAALEGIASAVTGAGVTKDQFSRYSNLLPTGNEALPLRYQKMVDANKFLLNQLNIAGPVAAQLRGDVQAEIQKYEALLAKQAPNPLGPTKASGGSSSVPQQEMARPASQQDFEALPSGTTFVAPDGSVRVKP